MMSLFKRFKRKKYQEEKEKVLQEIEKTLFPNGEIDIQKGTEETIFILKGKIDKVKARYIFKKSAALLEIVKPENRTIDRLKYSLDREYPGLFTEEEFKHLFTYLITRIMSKMIGGEHPKRLPDGNYYF